jgi:hypothetical protein
MLRQAFHVQPHVLEINLQVSKVPIIWLQALIDQDRNRIFAARRMAMDNMMLLMCHQCQTECLTMDMELLRRNQCLEIIKCWVLQGQDMGVQQAVAEYHLGHAQRVYLQALNQLGQDYLIDLILSKVHGQILVLMVERPCLHQPVVICAVHQVGLTSKNQGPLIQTLCHIILHLSRILMPSLDTQLLFVQD